MRNPELPIATGVAALLILVALPAKFRVRNIALSALVANCFFINLLSCINTLVWADHARDIAPIWCDITTNFWFYCPLAVLAAVLCTCRHLEWVSSQGTALGRRNSVRFEVALCVIMPLASIPIRAYRFVFSPCQLVGDLNWNRRIFPVPIPLSYPRKFWLCRDNVPLGPLDRANVRTAPRALRNLLRICRYGHLQPHSRTIFIRTVTSLQSRPERAQILPITRSMPDHGPLADHCHLAHYPLHHRVCAVPMARLEGCARQLSPRTEPACGFAASGGEETDGVLVLAIYC